MAVTALGLVAVVMVVTVVIVATLGVMIVAVLPWPLSETPYGTTGSLDGLNWRQGARR